MSWLAPPPITTGIRCSFLAAMWVPRDRVPPRRPHPQLAEELAQPQPDLTQTDHDDVISAWHRRATDDPGQAGIEQVVDESRGEHGGEAHDQEHRRRGEELEPVGRPSRGFARPHGDRHLGRQVEGVDERNPSGERGDDRLDDEDRQEAEQPTRRMGALASKGQAVDPSLPSSRRAGPGARDSSRLRWGPSSPPRPRRCSREGRRRRAAPGGTVPRRRGARGRPSTGPVRSRPCSRAEQRHPARRC